MPCSRCEKIPVLYTDRSDVYLTVPTNHHVALFESALTKKKYSFEAMEEGFLVHNVSFEEFLAYLNFSVFNTIEKKDVRILSLKPGASLSFSSLKNFKTLEEWMLLHQGREVAEIIEEGRIKTLFQPIISCKTGEVYGFEALSRGIQKDGTLMNPEKLFSEAKAMDLLFFLDRVCREASIKAAARMGIERRLFINFIPTAIYEPSLCLQSTARVLSVEKILAEQVVFEVVETEKVQDFGHLNRILDYYRERGFSTALDDVGSGYADVGALLKLRPNYMKIDMHIIRDIHVDKEKQQTLKTFMDSAKSIDALILAEGIETLEEYRYLKNQGVDLCQGYLFGKPQEIPDKKPFVEPSL